jgi:cyclic-di-GMP phosphodiesterase TipF (flagellum assembly factor)
VRALRRQQIDLIVEKVEDESLLIELLDSDVDYGQGYLFGEPRPARLAT